MAYVACNAIFLSMLYLVWPHWRVWIRCCVMTEIAFCSVFSIASIFSSELKSTYLSLCAAFSMACYPQRATMTQEKDYLRLQRWHQTTSIEKWQHAGNRKKKQAAEMVRGGGYYVNPFGTQRRGEYATSATSQRFFRQGCRGTEDAMGTIKQRRTKNCSIRFPDICQKGSHN